MHKTIAKNKASKETPIQCKKTKRQATKPINNCAQHIPKHCTKCKTETSKKNAPTNFDISKQKKKETTQEKKRNTKKLCIQKILHDRSMLYARKFA